MDAVRRSPALHRSLLGLAAVAVVAGVALLVVGLTSQESAPQPPRSVGSIAVPSSAPPPSSSSPSSAATPSSAAPVVKPLGPSRPVRLRIPSIDVDTAVNPIGLNADGTLGVPQPGPLLDQAAWFRDSPSPGQLGPSILEGHVDSTEGPSVFFRLGEIRPGARIEVSRADGRELTFVVDGVRDYDKSAFPTRVVYGGDLSHAQLRLITCSDFDASIGHHTGNQVVFSHLTRVTGA